MRTCAGAPGDAVTVDEGSPSPVEFSAITRKSYELSFERPVTVADSAVLVPLLNTDHVPLVLSLYSMM